MAGGTHEHYDDSHATVVQGSNRVFGFVFGGFWILTGIAPLLRGHSVRLWQIMLGSAVVAIAILVPSILEPANRAWTFLGRTLHRVTNPIIMGLMFFVLFAPIGFFRRLLGQDPLRLRFDRDSPSYWISRNPPGPPPESMLDQF